MQKCRGFSLRIVRCFTGAVVCFILLASCAAHASGPADAHLTDAELATLTLRAGQAQPRDQAQLYADLVNRVSILAREELADGDLAKAETTLHDLERYADAMEQNLQHDSRGLKKTELLLHDTHRRIADMVRAASGDMRPVVQGTLQRLEAAESSLLSAVFEK